MSMTTTDKNFENDVLKASGLVLVDFWAEWCGPCRMLAPVLDEVSEEASSKVKVVKVNIDENPDTATQNGVRSIPTLILFKDGKPVETRVGNMPKSKILSWIDSSL